MGKKGIPDRWLPYTPVGRTIEGTQFFAFKVPLKDVMCRQMDFLERFSPTTLIKGQPNISLVVDLTNTDRYYNKLEFLSKGIDYAKIYCQGHVIPNSDVVQKFFDVVDKFISLSKPADAVIGVHCTHGVNRTGYLICKYMIMKMGIKPSEAIEKFQKGRGHEIERKNYIADLLKTEPHQINKPVRSLTSVNTIYEEAKRILDRNTSNFEDSTIRRRRRSSDTGEEWTLVGKRKNIRIRSPVEDIHEEPKEIFDRNHLNDKTDKNLRIHEQSSNEEQWKVIGKRKNLDPTVSNAYFENQPRNLFFPDFASTSTQIMTPPGCSNQEPYPFNFSNPPPCTTTSDRTVNYNNIEQVSQLNYYDHATESRYRGRGRPGSSRGRYTWQNNNYTNRTNNSAGSSWGDIIENERFSDELTKRKNNFHFRNNSKFRRH